VNPQHFVSTVLLFLLAIGVKVQIFAADVEQPDRLAASNEAPRSFVDGSIFIGHGGVPAGADNGERHPVSSKDQRWAGSGVFHDRFRSGSDTSILRPPSALGWCPQGKGMFREQVRELSKFSTSRMWLRTTGFNHYASRDQYCRPQRAGGAPSADSLVTISSDSL
jgi:hypothetical protein